MENNKERMLKIAESLERDNKNRQAIKKKISEIGYKKPPVSGQFKKGVSGNPKGRPKKMPPKTILEALRLAFIKEVTITNEKGSREKISMIEAFAQKIIQDAIKKDGPTRKLLLQDLKFLNFDFWRMLEDKALQDFEPETSLEEEKYFKNTLHRILNEYFQDNPGKI